jgi:uncharacterized membrane protein YqjE
MPDRQADHQAPDPSLGELVRQLTEQTSRLLRDEVQLAKTELKESAKHAGAGAGLFGGAGLFALLGLATLVAAAVAALSLVFEVWLAALIVSGALFVVAAVAGLVGKKQVDEAGPPERAIENVKKDISEVKERRS